MPRPRSSTFYLPLAPVDAPLSLKAKLSVLPPSAANALLAPRHTPSCSQEFLHPNNNTSTNGEDECARLERVLGLNQTGGVGNNASGARRGARRHTDAPLPTAYGTHAPLPPLLPPPRTPQFTTIQEPWTPALTDSSSSDSVYSVESETGMELDVEAPTPSILPSLASSGWSEMKVETCSQEGFAGVSHSVLPTTATATEYGSASTLGMMDSNAMDLLEAAWDSEMATAGGRLSAEELTVATEADQVSFDHSTLNLDSFAGACDTLKPSTSHSRSNSAESLDSIMQPHYDPSFGLPRPSTARSVTSEPSSSQPCRTLSGVPCGLFTLLACRTKYRSPLCQSVTEEEEDTVHSSTSFPTLESGSLHHLDYRHLLPLKFRQSYPPPPPPCAAVMEAERATSSMVVSVEGEMEIPVIEDSDLEGVDASLPSDCLPTPLSTPSTSATALVKAPARQRFRTPPSHLLKLLRKSLGATTWARAETLACARASERRHGFALRTPLGGHLRGLDREGLLGLAYSELAGTPLSQLVEDGSSAHEWAYMAGVAGLGDEFGASEWDFEDDEEFDEEMDECDEELGEVAMEEEEREDVRSFVREGAPEPEERLDVKTEVDESVGYTMVGRFTWDKDWSPISPSHASQWPLQEETSRPVSQDASTASTSTSSVVTPTSATSNGETFWDMDDEEMSSTPTPSAPIGIKSRMTDTLTIPRPGEPPSMDGDEEEEEIFRYSPLRDDGFVYGRMDVEERNHEACDCPECQFQYATSLQPTANSYEPSSPSSPAAYQVIPSPTSSSGSIPVSPSFPPAPIVGTKISRSFSEDAFGGMSDEEMLDSPPQSASTSTFTPLATSTHGSTSSSDSRPLWASHHTRPVKAPRPLSLAQQQQQYPAYVSDEDSSPASGVFIIPPSPLNNGFGGEGGRTPTAGSTFAASGASTAPPVASTSSAGWYAGHGRTQSQERVLRSRSSVEHISSRRARQSFEKHEGRPSHEKIVGSSRRSFERIVKRESMDITDLRRSSEDQRKSLDDPRRSMELPNRQESTTPPVFVAPKPRRASRALEGMFGMESPKMRAGAVLPGTPAPIAVTTAASTSTTPAKAAWTFGSLKNALSNSVSHLVELARSRSPSPLPWISRSLTGAVASAQATPTQPLRPYTDDLESERSATPTPAGRSRGSSTATLTQSHIPKRVPQLALQTTSNGEGELSTSPPPKRTHSTSSLSSVNSEPESESGSSGGVFSRSPSPEPSAERLFDPSYSLTPRSRPISADAKAAAGGQLSPMMIPGSWDPEELWNDLQ